MNQKQTELVIGSLLHDYGKLLYRYNDRRSHSVSGYEYLKKLGVFEKNKNILDCVRYHHQDDIDDKIENDNICFITYIADNIASSDRRKKEGAKFGFITDIQFESVFNILNGNSENYVYKQGYLTEKTLYPLEPESTPKLDKKFYEGIVNETDNAIKGLELSESFINSLLLVLKLNLSFIPSSTKRNELVDISLYDHLKLTAAFASAIEQYLDEQKITDYKKSFLITQKTFITKRHLLFSVLTSAEYRILYMTSAVRRH